MNRQLAAMLLVGSLVYLVPNAHAREPGELFPAARPFEQGFLKVSDLHSIWYGLCGNPCSSCTAARASAATPV